jgi:hypothetical protein
MGLRARNAGMVRVLSLEATATRQLSSVRRRRRTTPMGGCLTSRPAGPGLNTVSRTPRCLCPTRILDRGAGAMTLDLPETVAQPRGAPFMFIWMLVWGVRL